MGGGCLGGGGLAGKKARNSELTPRCWTPLPTFWGFSMAKYNEEFKLKVTREAAQDNVVIHTLLQTHGIDRSTLRYWLQRYNIHGNNAFVKKHSYYCAEFKLQVHMHMKQNSLSSREATAYFDIRDGTGVISKWQKQYDEGGFTALEPRPKGKSSH